MSKSKTSYINTYGDMILKLTEIAEVVRETIKWAIQTLWIISWL